MMFVRMNLRSRSLTFPLILITILIFTSGFRGLHAPLIQTQYTAKLDQFDLLTENDGWISMGKRIFWTQNTGQAWVEITPALSSEDSILDVFFLDNDEGWILSRSIQAGRLNYSLMHTTDRGSTWIEQDLSLFVSDDLAARAERANMGWLDSKTGWIAFKHLTSANFSVGTLLITTDSGQSWKKRFLPLADNVVFNSPLNGWASGGPDGKQILRTQDGGQSWDNIRPRDASENAHIHPPVFVENHGTLVATEVETGHVFVYRTQDFGMNWEMTQDFYLGIRSNWIVLSMLKDMSFVAKFPGITRFLFVDADEAFLTENTDRQAESINALDMVTSQTGWGIWREGSCFEKTTCTSTTRLLRTKDGGKTWNSIILPIVDVDHITNTYENTSAEIPGKNDFTSSEIAPILIGQGFDACELPTAEELNTWKTASPYSAVNLYIGGSSRACLNTALNADVLVELNKQGWEFIPTWVGPQAPCSFYKSKMSADPAIAFTQGETEANAAVSTLQELSLTYPDQSGSVVYYDIEYYGTDTDCRAAVNSFMNGWVSRLHALDSIAGVYGSTLCNTGLSDFRDITHVPDVIWPARWYHNPGQGSYDPDATVWDLGSCLPNTVWDDHQRIRQYEGSHDETWGDVTLNIDNNVLDGVVAIPFTNPYVLSITRADPSPASTQSVGFVVTFSEPVTGVDASDLTLIVTGLTGTAIISVEDTGNQTSYLVTVASGLGNGTIRLNLNVAGTGIQDLEGKPLHGGFSTGKKYSINKRLQVYSQRRFDGWVLESDESSSIGGVKNKIGEFLRVGDDSANKQYRAVLSFGTSALPDDAVITAATLHVKPAGVIGVNPRNTHGRLILDIIKSKFFTRPALQIEDFQARPDKYRVGKFSKKLFTGWYKAVLFQRAYPYINMEGRTQFRLRFTLDDNDDNVEDILELYSGKADQVNRPQLTIDFFTPGNDPLQPSKVDLQDQHSGTKDQSLDADLYNLDLFKNTATDITYLHNLEIYKICYFIPSLWEVWHPDQSHFPAEGNRNCLKQVQQ
jgi:photosystem II stability/assembly factor-like uncharacterized protein